VVNIKSDTGEIEWGSMGCIDLALDRDKRMALVNTIMNRRDFVKVFTSSATGGLSRKAQLHEVNSLFE
jgi:hypothetical protein